MKTTYYRDFHHKRTTLSGKSLHVFSFSEHDGTQHFLFLVIDFCSFCLYYVYFRTKMGFELKIHYLHCL